MSVEIENTGDTNADVVLQLNGVNTLLSTDFVFY